MGGPGSGQWYRWNRKDTVEEHQALDIRLWQRRGWLRPGTCFSWNGVTVQVQSGRAHMSYRLRRGIAEGQNVSESIPLTWTPCHYGGQRPWFHCPGWRCDRRVAKLYLGGGAFRCRYCLDLGYESQRETPAFRLLAKTQNIRLRLGGSASLTEPFLSKPKGMHGHTFARLRWQAQEADWGSMHAMLTQLERRTPRRSR
jgi:hypothetical protein